MRTAILGAKGQLGSELVARLTGEVVALDRQKADLSRPTTLPGAMETVDPDIVVNCAAFTHVDRAEEEPDLAFAVNALAVRELARWCGARGRFLVQISTDHVFGRDVARRTPYRETDPPGPINTYGLSKLAGEQAVQAFCPAHLIVRTCGLYGRHGQGGKGTNFVETMLRLGASGKPVRVVADQVCTPTPAGYVAEELCRLIGDGTTGLLHLTCRGACSWFEFARTIFEMARLRVDLTPISTAEYGAGAPRPAYSVLESDHLHGGTPLSREDGLRAYLARRAG